MLSIKDFRRISLDDKSFFDKHQRRYPPVHSSDLFTTLISWMEYGDYHYAVVDDNIVIMSRVDDRVRFRLLPGRFNVDLVKQILNLALAEGSDDPFWVNDTGSKEWISKRFPGLKFLEYRDYFDYVYLSSDLARLPGARYGKIRNRLNKFKREYKYTVEEISEENIDEIRDFLKRWCLWKDCESDVILDNERKAILYSIGHFFDLELSGIAMRINGNVEAISVFEDMNMDTAVIHYEKGFPGYDGVYKAINMETAKILEKSFTFINREEDMGLPGLRQAKMSYRPHHMVKVFHVKKEDIVLGSSL